MITAGIEVALGVLIALAVRVVTGRLSDRVRSTTSSIDDLVTMLIREALPPFVVIMSLWFAAIALPLRTSIRHDIDLGLSALLILLFTVVAARIAGEALRSVALARAGVANSASIFVNIGRGLVFTIGFLVLLQSVGVSIAPLLTALGVGGLAVALALQDTLANLFAGIHILASKKVQPGDFVGMDTGLQGYVVDINWRNTTIRELPNNLIIVPNKQLSDSILTNYHRPERETSVLVQVGVSYDSDLNHVERVTTEVAASVLGDVAGGVRQFDPLVRFHTFGESSIDFSVIMRATEVTDQYLLTHEFIKRLHRRYGEEGIEIPFPIRTIVHGGNGTADPVPPSLNGGRREPAVRTVPDDGVDPEGDESGGEG